MVQPKINVFAVALKKLTKIVALIRNTILLQSKHAVCLFLRKLNLLNL